MKARLRKCSILLLLAFLFFSLFLISSRGVTRGIEVGPTVSPTAMPEAGEDCSLLDYQPGVPVCQQTRNLVPDFGFEEGIGWPYWYAGGGCNFEADEPGHEGSTSVGILGGGGDGVCSVYTPINAIPVQGDRSYDYAVWVRTALAAGGEAYLRVTFWSLRGSPPEWHYEKDAYTTRVRGTQLTWGLVTGSVRAPKEAQYARVEATMNHGNAGSVWFDDVFLGLATCLQVSKRASPALVMPGQMLTYTIFYTNTGREKATDAEVVETYEHVDFIDPRPPPCRGNHTWCVPSLPPGPGGPITIQVRVEPGAPSWVQNRVELFSDETVTPISATIYIQVMTETSRVVIAPPAQLGSGEPGRLKQYDLRVENRGSYSGLADLKHTSSRCVTVTITPPPPYVLEPGASRPVTVSLDLPTDMVCGERVVTILTATLGCEHMQPAVMTATLTTIIPSPIFIPVVARGYDGYFPSLGEIEPNNSCAAANGPLRPGKQYSGYPNDTWDYFSIDLYARGKIVVDLIKMPGADVQLQLRDQSCTRLCYDWGKPYHLEYGPTDAGQYYIGVYKQTPGSNEPYVLWVTLP